MSSHLQCADEVFMFAHLSSPKNFLIKNSIFLSPLSSPVNHIYIHVRGERAQLNSSVLLLKLLFIHLKLLKVLKYDFALQESVVLVVLYLLSNWIIWVHI